MDRSKSISSFLFTHHGRVSRKQFWLWWILPYIVLLIIASVIDVVLGTHIGGDQGAGIFCTILMLALSYPGVCIAIKRAHDIGRSGKFLLLMLIPLYGIYPALLLYFKAGSTGSNQYGDAE